MGSRAWLTTHENTLMAQAHEEMLMGLAHEHMLMGLAHENILMGRAHGHMLMEPGPGPSELKSRSGQDIRTLEFEAAKSTFLKIVEN